MISRQKRSLNTIATACTWDDHALGSILASQEHIPRLATAMRHTACATDTRRVGRCCSATCIPIVSCTRPTIISNHLDTQISIIEVRGGVWTHLSGPWYQTTCEVDCVLAIPAGIGRLSNQKWFWKRLTRSEPITSLSVPLTAIGGPYVYATCSLTLEMKSFGCCSHVGTAVPKVVDIGSTLGLGHRDFPPAPPTSHPNPNTSPDVHSLPLAEHTRTGGYY